MTADERPTAWGRVSDERRGGDGYRHFVAAARLLQARIAGAAPAPADLPDLTARLNALSDDLAPSQATSEHDRFDGTRADVAGRAMPLLPPYRILERGEGWVRGQVTFSRFYLGGGGAVHGGAHTLLFDDTMGLLAALVDGVTRTAYLKVSYRAITPIDVPLDFDCTVDRVERRKRFLTGRLTGPDGTLLADADGLFVRLLPGQP